MTRKLHLILGLCFILQGIQAQNQNDQVIGPPDEATHNAAKYNRFLFNPAFSFVKDAEKENGYISAFGRFEKSGFEDAPQNFRVLYNKTLNEKMSIGASLFQQNIGVLTHFGIVGNYAYNVEFTRDIDITFGANLRYQNSGLKSDIRSVDPIDTGNLEGGSLFRITPGLNIHYKQYDFGATVRNVVTVGGELEIYDSNTVVIHGMYSTPFSRGSDNTFRGMLYVQKETEADVVPGFTAFVENAKYGFAQLGYNNTYGISLGLGFNVAPQATIGYTIERGLGDADVFGLTHEVTLAYNFVRPQRKGRKKKPVRKKINGKKIPEREELSKADQIVALEAARAAQADKLLALQEARNKAALLRTTNLQERKDRADAKELVKIINDQIEGDDLESAQASLTRIQNNKYISDEDKKSILSRITRKVQLAEDIAAEETRIIQATAAKNEARALLTRASTLIDDNDIDQARATLERIKTSQYITEEEKQQVASRLERIVTADKEAKAVAAAEQAQIAAETAAKNEARALLTRTSSLIDENNIDQARATLERIKSSQYITEEEKQEITSRLERIVNADKEAKAEAEEKRQASELVRITNTLLDAQNVEEAKNNATLIRNNKFIPEEEKDKILSRLERVINEDIAQKEEAENKRLSSLSRVVNEEAVKAEAARVAAEQAAIAEQARIAAEAAAQAEAARIAEEQRIAAEQAAIAEQERIAAAAQAEAARIAEEQRIAAEQAAKIEQERLAAEQQQLAEAEAARLKAEEDKLAEEARLAAEAAVKQAEEEARLAAEQAEQEAKLAAEEAARLAEQTRLAAEEAQKQEEARLAAEAAAKLEEENKQKASELIRVTNTIIDSGDAEDAKTRMELIRQSTIIPDAEKQKIVSKLQRVINEDLAKKEAAAKLEEENKRKASDLIRVTNTIIDSGNAEDAKTRMELIRQSTIIPEDEKQKIVSKLQRVINEDAVKKEAARVAAEQARIAAEKAAKAEAARIAEEQRIAAEKAEAERVAEQARIAAETAAKAEAARIAEEQRIAAEKAEAARVAEQARIAAETAAKAEAARIAEEQRIAAEKAEAARAAEQARIAAETAAKAEAARIAEEQRIAAEKAEAARLVEAARVAAEKRQVEEAAKIAEQARVAAEKAAEAAEKARLAEEERLAEEARLEQEAANKRTSTLTKTTNTQSVPGEKRATAELKKVTKLVTDEDEKEKRRKAVKAALKRTTKTIQDNGSKSSTIRRSTIQKGSGTSNSNSNGMGLIEMPTEQEIQNKYFLEELFIQPKIQITGVDFMEVIDALVSASSTKNEKQNEKLIDLNQKKKKILKTNIKTIKTSENE